MTDTISSPKQGSHARRISENLAEQFLATARSRVPDVKRPTLAQRGARAYLRAARREYGLQANRQFNRATRRELAREVRFA